MIKIIVFLGSMVACTTKQDDLEDDSMEESLEQLPVQKTLKEAKNPLPKV